MSHHTHEHAYACRIEDTQGPRTHRDTRYLALAADFGGMQQHPARHVRAHHSELGLLDKDPTLVARLELNRQAIV